MSTDMPVNKWIVEDDEELGLCLILGKVNFHKQLTTNPDRVKGGGIWEFDDQRETVYLTGRSHDFGEADVVHIKEAIKKGNVFSNRYHTHRMFENCIFKHKPYGVTGVGFEVIS